MTSPRQKKKKLLALRRLAKKAENLVVEAVHVAADIVVDAVKEVKEAVLPAAQEEKVETAEKNKAEAANAFRERMRKAKLERLKAEQDKAE